MKLTLRRRTTNISPAPVPRTSAPAAVIRPTGTPVTGRDEPPDAGGGGVVVDGVVVGTLGGAVVLGALGVALVEELGLSVALGLVEELRLGVALVLVEGETLTLGLTEALTHRTSRGGLPRPG